MTVIALLCLGAVAGALLAGPWWFAAGYAECSKHITKTVFGGDDVTGC